jgi:hypothetical protein
MPVGMAGLRHKERHKSQRGNGTKPLTVHMPVQTSGPRIFVSLARKPPNTFAHGSQGNLPEAVRAWKGGNHLARCAAAKRAQLSGSRKVPVVRRSAMPDTHRLVFARSIRFWIVERGAVFEWGDYVHSLVTHKVLVLDRDG